jgi:hypothetical protein
MEIKNAKEMEKVEEVEFEIVKEDQNEDSEAVSASNCCCCCVSVSV